MKSSVALDGFPVDIGPDLDEVLRDLEVALVARDHEAGVSVPVRNLNVWKKRERYVFFFKKEKILAVGSSI